VCVSFNTSHHCHAATFYQAAFHSAHSVAWLVCVCGGGGGQVMCVGRVVEGMKKLLRLVVLP